VNVSNKIRVFREVPYRYRRNTTKVYKVILFRTVTISLCGLKSGFMSLWTGYGSWSGLSPDPFSSRSTQQPTRENATVQNQNTVAYKNLE